MKGYQCCIRSENVQTNEKRFPWLSINSTLKSPAIKQSLQIQTLRVGLAHRTTPQQSFFRNPSALRVQMKLQLAKTSFRIFRFGQVTFTDTNHKVLCFGRGQCPIFVHTILRRPVLETTGKARSD